MKLRTPLRALLWASLASAVLFGHPSPARADVAVDVTVSVFHDHLGAYGRWVSHPRFGTVWIPRVAVADWRPYKFGHWIYTDVGWTWMSDEPFGWATYHYGRWHRDLSMGWIWVPDTVWGPAWVAWRTNDADYIGWAPLPPDADIETDVIFEPAIEPIAFTFVHTRSFLEPQLVRFIEPPARNAVFIRMTRNVTTYTVVSTAVVSRGIAVEHVERFAGRPVPVLHLEATAVAGAALIAQDRVVVYRPVAPPPHFERTARGHATIAAPIHRRTVAVEPDRAVPRAEPPPSRKYGRGGG